MAIKKKDFKRFEDALVKIASYKPKNMSKMPSTTPPKKELERRWKLENGKMVEIKS